jgi:hypothetical protein
MDMRIIEVLHSFSTAGALTILTLVDDLVNSISQGPTELYSAIIKAVSPDCQDRTLGSLKSKDINIELEVLEKDYPS